MNLSSTLRRTLDQQPADSQDHERQRQDFQQWLIPPAPNDCLAPSSAPPSPRAHQALALELAPYQTQLANLGQFSQTTLTLRLTNGPLKGLEVYAQAQADTLYLQVRPYDQAYFEELASACHALESELQRRFHRPVILEIHDATTTTE